MPLSSKEGSFLAQKTGDSLPLGHPGSCPFHFRRWNDRPTCDSLALSNSLGVWGRFGRWRRNFGSIWPSSSTRPSRSSRSSCPTGSFSLTGAERAIDGAWFGLRSFFSPQVCVGFFWIALFGVCESFHAGTLALGSSLGSRGVVRWKMISRPPGRFHE